MDLSELLRWLRLLMTHFYSSVRQRFDKLTKMAVSGMRKKLSSWNMTRESEWENRVWTFSHGRECAFVRYYFMCHIKIAFEKRNSLNRVRLVVWCSMWTMWDCEECLLLLLWSKNTTLQLFAAEKCCYLLQTPVHAIATTATVWEWVEPNWAGERWQREPFLVHILFFFVCKYIVIAVIIIVVVDVVDYLLSLAFNCNYAIRMI